MKKELSLHLYLKMMEIRLFEKKSIEIYKTGQINGTIHPYLGQEAIGVAVCNHLRDDDYIVSNHRGHGHCLAKGAKFAPMLAELLGRETGYCKGRGGSMHIANLSVGILGANGIVGAGVPIAMGSALSSKIRETDQVTVVFFGDGAINQGAFYEAANMAAAWDLPVIFVCENNLYGVSTRIESVIPDVPLTKRGEALGFPGVEVDGNDIMAVYDASKEMVERARKGDGPSLLVANTYRWEGHFFGEPRLYRSREEENEWKESKDPIKLFAEKLKSEGLEKYLAEIDEQVEKELEEAVEFALNSPFPDPADLTKYVYYEVEGK